jgi:dephospho-CoA kinase
MLRIGLTGGLASGKSLIAKELARLGCHLIEADALGHEVLLPSGEAFEAVVREFGADSIVDPGGTIDRKKLSAIVFDDPSRLKALTTIVHPAVRRLAAAKTAAFERDDPGGILIYEAAILVETGAFRDFARLIVAACPEELQIERAMSRDGSTREAVTARLRRQLPLKEKLAHADFVIDTSGPKEQTIEQTRIVFERLQEVQHLF